MIIWKSFLTNAAEGRDFGGRWSAASKESICVVFLEVCVIWMSGVEIYKCLKMVM